MKKSIITCSFITSLLLCSTPLSVLADDGGAQHPSTNISKVGNNKIVDADQTVVKTDVASTDILNNKNIQNSIKTNNIGSNLFLATSSSMMYYAKVQSSNDNGMSHGLLHNRTITLKADSSGSFGVDSSDGCYLSPDQIYVSTTPVKSYGDGNTQYVSLKDSGISYNQDASGKYILNIPNGEQWNDRQIVFNVLQPDLSKQANVMVGGNGTADDGTVYQDSQAGNDYIYDWGNYKVNQSVHVPNSLKLTLDGAKNYNPLNDISLTDSQGQSIDPTAAENNGDLKINYQKLDLSDTGNQVLNLKSISNQSQDSSLDEIRHNPGVYVVHYDMQGVGANTIVAVDRDLPDIKNINYISFVDSQNNLIAPKLIINGSVGSNVDVNTPEGYVLSSNKLSTFLITPLALIILIQIF